MKNVKTLLGVFLTIGLVCIIAVLSILLIFSYRRKPVVIEYRDAVENVAPDTIEFTETGTQVHFADVIVGKQKEERKLIVAEQTTSVETDFEDHMIDKLDFDFLKRTQKVTYSGDGYFVIDLDNLNEGNVIQDDDNKLVTIKINKPYLETIEVNPDKIIIEEVQQGLLTWGDLKLSVIEYNEIENEIKSRMEENLNTVANIQKAEKNGLAMVREVYEPIIKAIDEDYSVKVEYIY